MFKCNECGKTFEEPDRWKEASEFWGRRGYVTVCGCPYCQSGDYEEYDPDEDEESEEDEDDD